MAMTINLSREYPFVAYPGIALAYDRQIERRTKMLRYRLESLTSEKCEGNLAQTLMGIDAGYAKKVNAVDTQEKYDEVYGNLYDIGCLSFVITEDLKFYVTQAWKYIKSIRENGNRCPCCYKEMEEEYILGLEKDAKEQEEKEKFYDLVCRCTMKYQAALRKKAEAKGYDRNNWHGAEKLMGSLEVVEKLEGEREERSWELEYQKTAIELALEYMEKEERASG